MKSKRILVGLLTALFFTGIVVGNTVFAHEQTNVALNKPVDAKGYFNLAKGKSVTASSQNPSEPAASAIDGDTYTFWGSGVVSVECCLPYLTVDLGASYLVDRVRVIGPAQWGSSAWIGLSRDANLDGSVDGVNFFSLYTWRDTWASPQDMSFTPISVRYVRYTNWQNWDGWNAIAEIEVFGFGKPENPGEGLSNVNDGNPSTFWGSGVASGIQLDVDLGVTYEVNRVVFTSPGSGSWWDGLSRDFDLEASLDGVSYFTIYQGRDLWSGVRDARFIPVQTRYIRYKDLHNWDGWVAIAEVEVFRVADSPALDKPVIASSENLTEPAVYANDGDYSTFWGSGTGWAIRPQITVDLGNLYEVEAVKLIAPFSGVSNQSREPYSTNINGWWFALSRDLEIHGSLDGVNFTPIIRDGDYWSAEKDIHFDHATVRYVRYADLYNWDGWVAIAEMEVYGSLLTLEEACDFIGGIVDDAVPTDAGYKNHGDYVHRVAQETEALVVGLPNADEIQSCVVSERAKSDVGKKPRTTGN